MQKLKYIFFLNVCDFQLTSIRDMEVQLYELNKKKTLLGIESFGNDSIS